MITYTLRRLAQGLAVVVVATFVTFLEAHLLPGNPARAILGVHASSAQITAFDKANGYDLPLPVRRDVDYIGRSCCAGTSASPTSSTRASPRC